MRCKKTATRNAANLLTDDGSRGRIRANPIRLRRKLNRNDRRGNREWTGMKTNVWLPLLVDRGEGQGEESIFVWAVVRFSLSPHGRYAFSVAQTSSLLYRGFPIRKPRQQPEAFEM